MSACKSLLLTSIPSCKVIARRRRKPSSLSLHSFQLIRPTRLFQSLYFAHPPPHLFLPCSAFSHEAVLPQQTYLEADADAADDDLSKDTVEELLARAGGVSGQMNMERAPETDGLPARRGRWFPYLDMFRSGATWLTSREVIDAVDPYILDARKERIRRVVQNRSYSVSLVVEGLTDFGNVSAAFRSADALGLQSVHVVSCDSSKRYRDNRHISMGAEKWLDIEVWQSTSECFKILKSRGYRIATTHLGTNTVSIYDMDFSCPTAIVVGNEHRGISDEALELADLHCSIPMRGMVDSFNVSVAAGILLHHAICDRMARLGCHGDLTSEESQILLAELSLRHSKTAVRIAHEYAKRKLDNNVSVH